MEDMQVIKYETRNTGHIHDINYSPWLLTMRQVGK